MATVQLGKIKQVWRGTYISSATYAVDDFVAYTDSGITSTYIAIAASSNTNQQVPSTSGTATANYWEYVAKGVANPIPTQSSSTNGKALVSDGTNASWGTAGKLLNVSEISNNGRTARSNSSTYDMVSGTFTQVGASSKFVVWGSCWWREHQSGEIRYLLYYGPQGGMQNTDEGRSGYTYTAQGHRFAGQGLWYFTGNSSAGTKEILWREHANDNSSQRSGSVFNPNNSSDDSRLAQQVSNLVIMEFAA